MAHCRLQCGSLLKQTHCPLVCNSVPHDAHCILPPTLRQCAKGNPLSTAPYSAVLYLSTSENHSPMPLVVHCTELNPLPPAPCPL